MIKLFKGPQIHTWRTSQLWKVLNFGPSLVWNPAFSFDCSKCEVGGRYNLWHHQWYGGCTAMDGQAWDCEYTNNVSAVNNYFTSCKEIVESGLWERVLDVLTPQDFKQDGLQTSSRPSKMIALTPSISTMMKKASIFFCGWIRSKLPWFHQPTLERRQWNKLGRKKGKITKTNIICLFSLEIFPLQSLKFLASSMSTVAQWKVSISPTNSLLTTAHKWGANTTGWPYSWWPGYHTHWRLNHNVVGVKISLQWTKTIPNQIHQSTHRCFNVICYHASQSQSAKLAEEYSPKLKRRMRTWMSNTNPVLPRKIFHDHVTMKKKNTKDKDGKEVRQIVESRRICCFWNVPLSKKCFDIYHKQT